MDKAMAERPFIYRFFASPLSGDAIEAQSFKMIDEEVGPHAFGSSEWQVVRRMIHATGDPSIIRAVKFSPQAIPAAIDALRRGRLIYVDSKMIRAGLSLPRLQGVYKGYHPSHIICHVDDEDVIAGARQAALPRSLFAIRKAKGILEGALAIFGNSPIALLEMNRLVLEENIRPALVIAMPVGFVHVIESKAELIRLDVPHIALTGRRGGSHLAVSVVHALCVLAEEVLSKDLGGSSSLPSSDERRQKS